MTIRDRFRPCSRDSSGGRTKTARGINEKTKLSNAAMKIRSELALHNVDLQALISVAALLNLVFSLMPRAVFVLRPDESLEQGRNRSQMLNCVIPVML